MGGLTTRYVYNHDGIRVRSTTGSNPTQYSLIDPNNPTGYAQVLEEATLSGGVLTPLMSYIIGDDVLAQATGSGVSYLLYDGHGSTRQLSQTGNTIAEQYNYDAYGIAVSGVPSSPATKLLYAGEQFDVNMQQYYLRARYYDPANGRFNQMDTFAGGNFDPQSLHKYAYCNGDPVNGIDPSGNGSLVETIAVVAILTIVAAILITAVVGSPLVQRGWVLRGSHMYERGMHGPPNYNQATDLLDRARKAMDDFDTPRATTFYDTFYGSSASTDAVESHHIYFLQHPADFLGMTPTIVAGRSKVYLSQEWYVGNFNNQQRGLILLHELRHAISGELDEHVVYRTQYIAETRYRWRHNAHPLPVPPAEPANLVFSEAAYGGPIWGQYIPLADRQAIVKEINATGSIADDAWPETLL